MPRRALVWLLTSTLLLVSCAARGGLVVELDEYSLEPAKTSSKPGDVTFTARNFGAIAHQLVVLKTERPADRLPVKGGVVQIDRKDIVQVGEVALINPKDDEPLSVRLRQGDFVLICNIAGHYDNGMRSPFRVRP